MYSLLADAVLVLHAALVVFVIAGLPVVWLGNWRQWRWVNAWWFRLTHLAVIVVVVLQAWLGQTCPLTSLEVWLRARAGALPYGGGFIQHWVGRLLFYEAPAWVFTIIYTTFGALVAASWWRFPPTTRQGRGGTFGARKNIMQSGERH